MLQRFENVKKSVEGCRLREELLWKVKIILEGAER
jgi:hypothetical protein